MDLPITPIIVAIRAPLLSATSSLDRSCTIRIFLSLFSLLLDNLPQTPALKLAQPPCRHDPNRFARFRLVLFVVRVKFSHLFNDFAELGMRHARDRLHDNRLVHAAGNHFAGPRLARTAGEGYRQRGRLLILLSHKFTFSQSLSSAVRALFQCGQHLAAANVSGLASRADRSAVASADASVPAASPVSWSATHPYSIR